MKKIAIGVVALLAIAVAALVVGPSFVDWNSYKDRIAAEVRAATGRDLTIAGDLSLTLIPTPALSADGVSLANIPGGGQEPMVSLHSLRVRVAFLPLLQGHIQVEDVVLVEPVVRLEVLADGRRNWDLAAGSKPAAEAPRHPAEGAGLPGQIRLDSLRVRNGTVIYSDARSGQSERIEALNAEISADSLKGPFAAKGEATARGVPLGFELSLGRLRDEGTTPLGVELRMAEAGKAAVKFSGALSPQSGAETLNGRLTASGESLARLVGALSGAAAPAALAQPFDLAAEVTADSGQVDVAGLDLRLGEVSLNGKGSAKLGTPIKVQVSLGVPQLDLDSLLKAAATRDAGAAAQAPAEPAGQAAAPPAAAGGAALPAAAGGAALPDNIDAKLDVAIEALVYRGQVIRQFLLSASLAQGRLRLDQALALLPGGSDLSLSGALAPRNTGAGTELAFDGRVEATSDNLRAVLQWLGADVAKVPAGRLRRSSLTSRVEATTRQVTLREIDLRVDLSRVTGGVAIALRDRPGLGIGLAVDQIDLDAYLPQASAAQPGAQEGGAQGTAGQAPAAAPSNGASGAPAAGPLAVLDTFDANLDLKVGRLALHGLMARDLRLDATLQQGGLTLRDASVADLAGSSMRLSGSIADLAKVPKLDTTFSLSVADPARLAKLIGPQAEPLARLGAVQADGTLRGTAAAPAFDLGLQALGGRFGAKGTAKPMAVPPTFDVDLSVKHPDVARLARSLDPALSLGAGLGGLDAKGHLSGSTAALQASDLDGTVGPLHLTGSLRVELGGDRPQVEDVALDLVLKHDDLGTLLRALAPNGPAPKNLGPVDLSARLTGSSRNLEASDLHGKLGLTEIAGTLGADLTGSKPRVTADLTTGELPLAALAAPAGAARKDATAGAAGGQTKAGQGAKSGRWSRDTIDLGGLQSIDADLKLKSKALVYDKLRLDDAVLEAALADGLLDLRRLDGRVFGGTLSLTGTLDAREAPRLALTVVANKLELGRLLADVAETDRVSGPLSVNATLNSTGRSEAELVGALAGSGDLNGTLKVKAKAEEKVGNLVLDILGQKIKEIRGITGATNVLFNAFADAPAKVTGTFTIEHGVLLTEDTRVQGRQATALAEGTADLPAWLLDMRTNVYRAPDNTTPFVTVDLRGPLDAPNPRIGGQVLQRQPQAAPSGPVPSGPVPSGPVPSGSAPSGNGAAQPAPQQPAPGDLKPEDVLKQGLKGLLKGLGN